MSKRYGSRSSTAKQKLFCDNKPSLPIIGANVQHDPCKDRHHMLELHVRPCLDCSRLCNCQYTFFPKLYPDVLVRSLDKHIVRLNGDLVRSSVSLSSWVDNILNINARSQLDTEYVFLSTEINRPYVITDYKVNFHPEFASSSSYTTTSDISTYSASEYQRYKRGRYETSYSVRDLIEIRDKKQLLVLFDTQSDRPTLGIEKETLMSVSNFICQHLDEVDTRVKLRWNCVEYFKESHFGEPPDEDFLNTFVHEDWEEDFFNIDAGKFYDLQKANQELLIWDFHLAIEKWTLLKRGFPRKMVNGCYDIFTDPEYENCDRRNNFGLNGIGFRNPRRKSFHKASFDGVYPNEEIFLPKWWIASF